MTELNKSALLQYAEICRLSEIDAITTQFDSYPKTLDEIQRLRAENYRLKLANALLTHKRGRGRPKKLIKPLGGNLGFFGPFLPESTVAPPKRKGGRPIKQIHAQMREVLQTYDNMKNEAGRSTLTDKKLVETIVNIRDDTKNLRSDKKADLVASICRELKYFRDETGIRQKQKSGKPRLK